MDVSELRKRILRALDEARRDAALRRPEVDAAAQAYQVFLADVAVPLMRQAAQVLNATGEQFAVETPAASARLVSSRAPQTFIEFELERDGSRSRVIGRVSVTHGRQGVVIDEKPIGDAKPVSDLAEDDVSAFLVAEIPKLVLKS